MILPVWIHALSPLREQAAHAGYSFVSQTHLLGMRPLFRAITGPGRSGTRCPGLVTEKFVGFSADPSTLFTLSSSMTDVDRYEKLASRPTPKKRPQVAEASAGPELWVRGKSFDGAQLLALRHQLV